MHRKLGHAWAVVLLWICPPAMANLVVNGSFESPVGQHYIPVFQTFDGWRVTGDGGVKVGDFWQAAQGNQEIDLCGISGGSIMQMIATTTGQRYVLTFALAGNPGADPPTVKPMIYVIGDGDPQTVTFDITGHSATDMGWKYYHIPFVATSDSTALEFATGLSSDAGPALDDVSVNAVPPGDANQDGHVAFDDLLALAQHYGSSSATWADGDFDGDGTVGFSDLLALAQHYGQDALTADATGAFGVVPEPGLVCACPVAMLIRRRRKVQCSYVRAGKVGF